MSPSSTVRIIPAHQARTREVESFPYVAAEYSPLSLEEGSLQGEHSLASELSTPEEDARRLASVDQQIIEKLQQAERDAQEVAHRAYEQGFAAGEEEGRAFGESQYQVYVQRLESSLGELSQAASLLGQATREEFLALALSFGEYLAGRSIELSEDAIGPLLATVLDSHPFNGTESPEGTALTVYLNPKDLEQLGGAFAERPGLTLREDPELSRGGLRVDAADGVLEATVERRRERLLQLIHRSLEREG